MPAWSHQSHRPPPLVFPALSAADRGKLFPRTRRRARDAGDVDPSTLDLGLLQKEATVGEVVPPAVEFSARGYTRISTAHLPLVGEATYSNDLPLLWPEAPVDWGIATTLAVFLPGSDFFETLSIFLCLGKDEINFPEDFFYKGLYPVVSGKTFFTDSAVHDYNRNIRPPGYFNKIRPNLQLHQQANRRIEIGKRPAHDP